MFVFTYAIAYGLITLAASYVAFAVTGLCAHWVYEALIEWFPNLIRDYSPILEADKFNSAAKTVNIIGIILAVLITSMIVTRLDNGRDEFIIKKTEGFYRIPEIMSTYYKTYAVPDLVASLVNTVIISALIIPAHLIEFEEVNGFTNLVKSFRGFHLGVLFDGVNPILSVLLVFVIFYLSKLISGIHGLKKWRASWLAYN